MACVRYPGLPSHPTHEIAAAQLGGFGTMISFDVRGDAAAAEAVFAGLEVIRHATSLGSVEATIERRAAYAGQEHLPPGLLRLSVGIEACEDLVADLQQALASDEHVTELAPALKSAQARAMRLLEKLVEVKPPKPNVAPPTIEPTQTPIVFDLADNTA